MQREVAEMAYNTYKDLIYKQRSDCINCGALEYTGPGGSCEYCVAEGWSINHSDPGITVGDTTITLEDLKVLEKSLSWQEAMNKELTDKVKDLKNAIIEFKEFAEEQSRNSRRPASVRQPWNEVVEHCLATLEKNE